MKKYRCKICGHIYDEAKEKILFKDLPDDWVCPLCGVPKSMFELVEEEVATPSKAVKISKDNVAISRIMEKCIDCGICAQTCKIREGMEFDANSELCVNCGQCIQTCPTGALVAKDDTKRLEDALNSNKICIAYTSPSVRVAFAESFGASAGTFSQEKMVGALKELGFDYVFDTTFAADLTIMEEANELVERITNQGKLPMFTSCCPAWIKYAEQFYPEILGNISTCKSPIGMMGMAVKKYFCKMNHLDENNIFTVAITPCTAKKFEISREEIAGTDLVITTSELTNIIKAKEIKYDDIKDSTYDEFFPEGSGAGVIFGNTGGVMEAALRTAYNMVTNTDLALENIEFNDVRGFENVKEATIKINDLSLNVAVIHGMSYAKEILEQVKNGTSKYHYIEIMNCQGGCIGGGGQPKVDLSKEEETRKQRIASLYSRDKETKIKCSHHNPQIQKMYQEFLGKPGSKLSEELLHTSYYKR